MNSTVLALLVGLVGGVCGALMGGMVSKGAAPTAPDGGRAVDLSSLERRLEDIQAQLDELRLGTPGEPTLRGSAAGAEAMTAKRLDALADALAERLEPSVRKTVGETVKESIEEMGRLDAIPSLEVPAKKAVTLAEAARELELSAQEEADVRRITEESVTAFLEALADKETGIEGVKQDLLAAKDDPAKRAELIPKYLGRLMGNLGKVIVIGTEHEKKMEAAIGKEKAGRLDSEFALTDVDPYDLEGVFEGFGD